MTFIQTVGRVISLAEAIDDYWSAELPKRHPDFPLVHPGEQSGPPPQEEKILKDFLLALPEDDIYKLALVMSLGRGDFGTDDLASRYEDLKEIIGNADGVVALLGSTASLADYLVDGLEELKRHGVDVDQLAFQPVNSAG